MNLNVNLELVRAARSKMATHKDNFERALNQLNSSIEGTTGVISKSANQVRERYMESARSQEKLKEAVNAYISYLDGVISTYEQADQGNVGASSVGASSNSNVSIN